MLRQTARCNGRSQATASHARFRAPARSCCRARRRDRETSGPARSRAAERWLCDPMSCAGPRRGLPSRDSSRALRWLRTRPLPHGRGSALGHPPAPLPMPWRSPPRLPPAPNRARQQAVPRSARRSRASPGSPARSSQRFRSQTAAPSAPAARRDARARRHDQWTWKNTAAQGRGSHHRFKMIRDGDRVAVALSGGKDSADAAGSAAAACRSARLSIFRCARSPWSKASFCGPSSRWAST
jgi:pyruvate/2-oxoglutarate dehydrogenase complex dihydrolipoamide acyltransferase (E2) component